jgi:hypothetical protein
MALHPTRTQSSAFISVHSQPNNPLNMGHYTISDVSLVIILWLWQNWVLEKMLSETQ